MNQNSHAAISSWRQEPIVWMIIMIPLSSVLVGFIMLWFAIDTDDGLVFDDYHQQGKEINRVLERDAMASSLGVKAQIALLPDSHRLELSLSYRNASTLPDLLSLRFLHPTRAGEDIYVPLQRSGNNEYIGEFPRLSSAKWIVQLETDAWRINGLARIPGSNLIRLEAR